MSKASETARLTRVPDGLRPAVTRRASAWAPPDVPLDVPSAARMYDYLLGGHHNFASDRAAADAATAIYPDFPLIMQANRMFLRRAVRFLIGQGIDRFLDVGSGIPTSGNVHQVAELGNPSARVVYVDNDPIAVAHSAAMLRDHPRATIISADLRQPERIFEHPAVRELLTDGAPIAVLLLFVLHFIIDDDKASRLVRAFCEPLPSGSYVAISHGTGDGMSPEQLDQLLRLYERSSNPVRTRPRAEIERYFEGLELVEPGLVHVPSWRPEDPDDLLVSEPERSASVAGIGRKP